MYGNGGGSYFSSSTENTQDISGIRVFISPIGIFRSIQFKYGSSWSERLGVLGGRAQEFILQPDEYIIGVYGTHRIYLRYMVIYTNLGRWAAFGKEEGRSFVAYPDQPDKVLTGLFGQHRPLGITGIGFHWDYPLVDPVTEQPQTTQMSQASST
ncbi:PREDICTED: zymogen granule protein 16 homolog B [Miniopterus natalensis]|uniref:zymogen granule protein 16 homolog B n=1 Tax=Miniopterus natalensis TaxID=291302 RepID=UPI0007A6B46B|nr:PREDICTED: zymogen granule protein 16 homolog B [Miniopterus natalensis]